MGAWSGPDLVGLAAGRWLQYLRTVAVTNDGVAEGRDGARLREPTARHSLSLWPSVSRYGLNSIQAPFKKKVYWLRIKNTKAGGGLVVAQPTMAPPSSAGGSIGKTVLGMFVGLFLV